MLSTKAGCAAVPDASRLSSEEKKIWPVIAMPSALPICWNDCSAPEPEPASRGGTVHSTVWNSGAIAAPMPRPDRNSGSTKRQ